MLDKRAGAGLAAAAVVLGHYLGLASFTSGRVAPGVTVGGVVIGGMTSQEAMATLERAVSDTASIPVQLSAPSGSVGIQPVDAGLQIDLAATMAGLTGFTMNRCTGGRI